MTTLATTRRERLAWAGATVLVVGFSVLVVCLRDAAPVATAEPHAPQAAPTGQAPPCIHEVCGERPARLRCYDYSTYLCRGYAIDYERHCTCDTWATVATDGGAP